MHTSRRVLRAARFGRSYYGPTGGRSVYKDIHDNHKMAGEETRKLVWEGKLPICFSLHPDEVRDVRRDMNVESCYVSFVHAQSE